jgi:hypothetical protein
MRLLETMRPWLCQQFLAENSSEIHKIPSPTNIISKWQYYMFAPQGLER